MRKSTNVFLLTLILCSRAFAQEPAPATDARALAGRALAQARAGETEQALDLYSAAVRADSGDAGILTDYAVVLGWSEKYTEAFPLIARVRLIEKTQPEWALREFAGIYLFGDAPAKALEILNELMDRGDFSEQTLVRRALALRWMGNAREAQAAYKVVLEHHPESAAGVAGMAYALADTGELTAALHSLEQPAGPSSQDPQLLKARVRILNWMGRHYEAQGLLAGLPQEMALDREILEDRISANRWGGNPSEAMRNVNRLLDLYPGAVSDRTARELRTEFGSSIAPSFRYGKDSDGLVDRSAASEGSYHITPSHVLHLGYQYRWFEQQDQEVRSLVRYDVGWSGNLSSRLGFYTTLSSVDYRMPGLNRKLTGDASLTAALNDSVRVSGGAGIVAADAFQSLDNQVTAPFGFGDIAVAFDSNTRFQARYARYSFSDDVVRDRADFEFMRTLLVAPAVRFSAGWRSNLMWHDAETEDFYSPSTFQSHLGVAQAYGRVTSWLDYSGEIAAGWQAEPGTPLLHPFQTNGKLVFHAGRNWRTVVEAGRSTSSLDRVLPGQRTYSRWVAGVGMEFRFQ